MRTLTLGGLVRRAVGFVIVLAAIFAAALTSPPSAAAHGGVGIGFSFGFPGAYVAPPVVYAPPPVYYPAPAVVYGPPVYRHRYYRRVHHCRSWPSRLRFHCRRSPGTSRCSSRRAL